MQIKKAIYIAEPGATRGLHTLCISHEDCKHFQKKYFNYSLQKQDETVREVCFSPQKYAELKAL